LGPLDTANLSGCAICFGEDVAAVWKHQRELKRDVVAVIDESHFTVRIAGCPDDSMDSFSSR
jgi:hypothetical protein